MVSSQVRGVRGTARETNEVVLPRLQNETWQEVALRPYRLYHMRNRARV